MAAGDVEVAVDAATPWGTWTVRGLGAHRLRLAIVVSHPIQYQAPLFRRLAQSSVVDPYVLFLSDHGLSTSFDEGFGAYISYDVPLAEGYEHEFLRNRAPRASVSRFSGLVNPSLLSKLSPGRTDVVLVHGWAHASDWLALLTSRAKRIPYLLRGEARADLDYRLSRSRLRLKRALLRPIVRHAGACLAIGSLSREFYLTYGAKPDRVFDAPYSIETTRFERAGRAGRRGRRERLVALGLDPSLPVILFAAKYQPWKRPLDLVRAVQHMEKQVNVLFIGSGPMQRDIETAVAPLPNARVLGFVNQREIGGWYGLADLFVLPSVIEPWGLAVNEAMAAGAVPVVADIVGCAPDLVTPDTGRHFRVGDIYGLATTLSNLLSQPTRMKSMSEAAQRRARLFGIEATARGIEAAAKAAASEPLP